MKVYNVVKIADMLMRRPYTVRELMRITGLSRSTVGHHLERVRECYPLYISGWQRTVGQMAAVYAVGNGEDAPRPKPLYPKPVKKVQPESKGAWG